MSKRLIDVELLERVSRDISGREGWDALDPDALQARKDIRAILAQPEPAAGVDWREHSRHIAKGEKCPPTIETLQAAWARDQELMEDQRKEISSLKRKLNQATQSLASKKAELAEWAPAMQKLGDQNQVLREELSACAESPGGCGYWREAARHRETERDAALALLQECRPMVKREVERWTRAAAVLPVNANVESSLLARIDAMLSSQAQGGERV